MSNKYFITLTPLDWFFFGGEKTLNGGQKADYFARSNKFPQQTAVLGMLRYQLLKQKGWLKNSEGKSTASDEEMCDLIGKSGFSMNNPNATFGKIKKLSPVGLYGKELFIPMPLDKNQEISFEDAKVQMNNVEHNALLLVDKFDHKNYCNYDKWISKQYEKESKDIFESKMQIGITKNGDDDAFYKQEVFRLKDGFKFAFYAEIDEVLTPDFVYLGAQQSCFKMEVQVVEKSEDIVALYQQACPNESASIEGVKRIVLLSNSYVEELRKLQELCLFQWSNSECFRNMEQCDKGNLHSGAVRYKKQEVLYNFISAGSVLYYQSKNEEAIKKMLNLAHLQTIGYNYFI